MLSSQSQLLKRLIASFSADSASDEEGQNRQIGTARRLTYDQLDQLSDARANAPYSTVS